MVESQQADIDAVLALVQQFARRFMPNPHDADDLVQEVLIKALRAYRRNPAISDANDAQVAAWLLLITRRTAIDMVRAAKRHAQEPLTDCHYAPGSIESGVETRESINVALSRLPVKERVLLLLDAQGYTDEEIAQHVQMTRGSVKSRLHRARVVIREVAA